MLGSGLGIRKREHATVTDSARVVDQVYEQALVTREASGFSQSSAGR